MNGIKKSLKRAENFEAKQGFFLHIKLNKSFKLVPWFQKD